MKLTNFLEYDETNEFPKNYKSLSLIALLDKSPVPGISYRINKEKRWPIYINKKMGWVCIGNPKTEGKQLIEFAPNCVATLENHDIR